MDLQSLVPAHFCGLRGLTKMDALAEDRYYRNHMNPSRLRLLVLAPIVTTACVVILLVGIGLA